MKRLLATLLATAVGVLGFSGATSAAPIISFGTSGGSLTFTANPTTGFTTTAGTIGSANTTGNVPTAVLNGATFSNVTYTLTNVSGTTGGFNLATPNVPTTRFVVDPAGPGVATFVLLNPFNFTSFGNSGAPNFAPTFLNIDGEMYLESNTSGVDFGFINQIWNLNPTVSASVGFALGSGTPGSIQFLGGNPSPALSANSTGRTFILIVPEPATLAICGIFGVAGLVAGRRKLKAKKVAEATAA